MTCYIATIRNHVTMVAKWHPIKLSRPLVIAGGYARKTHKLETRDVATPDGTSSFVKVDKRQCWMYKTSVGMSAKPSALYRTNLLDTMKKALVAARKRHDADPMTAAVSADDSDPMSALAELKPEYETPKTKRRSYTSKRGKNLITEITMPELEPTAHPGDDTTRVVRLLALSTNSLWISVDDLEWLVRWLADEYKTGGIADPAVAEDKLTPNCSVPGVHIRWDFAGAWEATILEGPKAGTNSKSFVDKLTLEKWSISDAVHHYATPFKAAVAAQKKQATFHDLEITLRQSLYPGAMSG